ncbi:hypothetical protein ABFU82_12200 [Nocardioides sp. WV_118_6]
MAPTISLRTVAAAAVAAATVLLLPQAQAPAAAASCPGATGVTVVVDPNELGGGISAGCDGNGGGPAASNFAEAGYTFEYSQAPGMSGFVCKVNGRPADGDCTTASSYWSLWSSDGKSGTWAYANRGVTTLKVPTGGYVAFAWHQGSGRAAPPDVTPTPRVAPASPQPSVKPKPSAKPSAKPNRNPGTTPSATPTTASPTTSATPTPSESALSAKPTPTPPVAPVPTDPGGNTDVPSVDDITNGPDDASAASGDDTDGGGFPVWLGAVLAVVVLGGAAAVPILRRRG